VELALGNRGLFAKARRRRGTSRSRSQLEPQRDRQGWEKHDLSRNRKKNSQVLDEILVARVELLTAKELKSDDWLPVHDALSQNRDDLFKRMLQANPMALSMNNKEGWTTTHLAVVMNNVEALELLEWFMQGQRRWPNQQASLTALWWNATPSHAKPRQEK
jgi:hypothetical protein